MIPAPEQVKVNGGIAGQLKVSVKRAPNTRAFELQIAPVGPDGQTGEWTLAGIHTNSRAMIAAGLESGALYAVRLRFVGGLTGYSGWSNKVISRCP